MSTKQTEALKLALEALEPFITPNWAGTGVDKANEAYAAIREALAEQPPCKYPHCPYPCPDLPDCRDAEQPASKPWVGLTEDERNAIGRHHAYVDNIIRATEAKLKDKNGY